MIQALVKVGSFSKVNGIGHFTRRLGDIQVDLATVQSSGFQPLAMRSYTPAIVEFTRIDGRFIATKILQLDGKTPSISRTIVDRKGSDVAVKVTLGANAHYEVRDGGIDGQVVYDNLPSLTAARQVMGKAIFHPVVEGRHGVKTNVPKVFNKPGSNDNEKNKNKGGKKKAA